MTTTVIHYEFIQKFKIPARSAFAWCTDYCSKDMELMQIKNATRRIQRITDDTIILIDTFITEGKSIEKQKLVCLYPARMMWTSTHLAGPNRNSQFLYEITPQNMQHSQLKFTALSIHYQIEEKEQADKQTEELKKMDLKIWKRLAREMEEELNQ